MIGFGALSAQSAGKKEEKEKEEGEKEGKEGEKKGKEGKRKGKEGFFCKRSAPNQSYVAGESQFLRRRRAAPTAQTQLRSRPAPRAK